MENKQVIQEQVENKQVKELIGILKVESFGNEDQRKRMLDVLTSLLTIKDKEARKIFKKVGEFFTDLGEEMLDEKDENNTNNSTNVTNKNEKPTEECAGKEKRTESKIQKYEFESEWGKTSKRYKGIFAKEITNKLEENSQ